MSLQRVKPLAAGLLLASIFGLGMAPSARTEGPLSPGIGGIARLYSTPELLAGFLRKQMTFREDNEIFGRRDYWQAPEEFLRRREGDCEDYALLAQAVLERQGMEALVLSVYGPGYAHTVCLFREGGYYNIFNQDKVIRCRAASLEEAASVLYPRWSWGAVARRFGRRGRAVQRLRNPVAF